jgi:long-chain acyl-CoA synthetase
MLQGYGLTEASPVLTLNPEEAPMDESVGLPLPEVEVTVLDPDENGQGELAFRGPMVMKGYYRNPEATADVLDNEGWLKTGDLGHQDRQGYLYVSGRKKNLIVTAAGKNVSPEVEAELNLSPFVLESMVHGQAAPNKDEEVHAVIVPDYEAIGAHVSGKRLSDDEIRRLIQKEVRSCMKALAPYKHVKAFRIQDEEFPKTSTRKIKRHLFGQR